MRSWVEGGLNLKGAKGTVTSHLQGGWLCRSRARKTDICVGFRSGSYRLAGEMETG